MMTVVAYATVAILLATVAGLAHGRARIQHRAVVRDAWWQLRPLLWRLPPALLAGVFLAQLVPEAHVVALLGEASALRGVLLATLIGGLLPGGPMIAFPLALALLEAGMGTPQMVTLITAWSVLAFHRVLVFEAPMLGWRFAGLRVLASLPVAPAAGLATLAVQHATGTA